MKKELNVEWNKSWNPKLALIQKKEMNRYPRVHTQKLVKPIFDGQRVYASNGHIMAVFPTKKRIGRKYNPKVLDVKKVMPTRINKLRIAFNPIYLSRLLKSMGHDNKKRMGCIFELDPKNNHGVIRVELTPLSGNKAVGFLMPMRNSGEDFQPKSDV